jgi:hypothetical protein
VWEKDETYLYLPLRPDSARGDYLLVNTNGNLREVMAEARRITESLDPRMLAGLQRTQDHLEIQLAPFRAMASIAGALGLLALLLASVLIDLSPVDPLAFGGVAVLLTLVALLACWIPAWRAAKADPLVTLRCD